MLTMHCFSAWFWFVPWDNRIKLDRKQKANGKLFIKTSQKMTVTQILCVKSGILCFPNSSRVVLHTSWELEMFSGSLGAAPCGHSASCLCSSPWGEQLQSPSLVVFPSSGSEIPPALLVWGCRGLRKVMVSLQPCCLPWQGWRGLRRQISSVCCWPKLRQVLQRQMGEIPACPNPKSAFALQVECSLQSRRRGWGRPFRRWHLSFPQSDRVQGRWISQWISLVVFSLALQEQHIPVLSVLAGFQPLAHHVLAACQCLVEQWPYCASPGLFTGVHTTDSVALTCLIILKSSGQSVFTLFISLSFCVLKNLHDPALQGLHQCCLGWQWVCFCSDHRTRSSCHLLSLCFSHMSSLPRSTLQPQLCPLHVSVTLLAVEDLFFSTSLNFPCVLVC